MRGASSTPEGMFAESDRSRGTPAEPGQAGARGARVVDHLPAAVGSRTRPLQREESLRMADAALTAASWTGFGSGAGLGARARTGLAGYRGWNAYLGILSRIGLLQVDFHV